MQGVQRWWRQARCVGAARGITPVRPYAGTMHWCCVRRHGGLPTMDWCAAATRSAATCCACGACLRAVAVAAPRRHDVARLGHDVAGGGRGDAWRLLQNLQKRAPRKMCHIPQRFPARIFSRGSCSKTALRLVLQQPPCVAHWACWVTMGRVATPRQGATIRPTPGLRMLPCNNRPKRRVAAGGRSWMAGRLCSPAPGRVSKLALVPWERASGTGQRSRHPK